MLENSYWISGAGINGCPEFCRGFRTEKKISSAKLTITALGVYTVYINGHHVGNFHLAPGWTVYRERVQVQTYDVKPLLTDENEMIVTLGTGWYSGAISRAAAPEDKRPAFIAELEIVYSDKSRVTIVTDEDWRVRESHTTFADIYHGEHYDSTLDQGWLSGVEVRELSKSILIPQYGEEIVAMEELAPVRFFMTPNGEKVLDFGQEITGFVRFTVNGEEGQRIRLTCAEMLDADGNFYTENYRAAKSEMIYICRDGVQSWNPELTFYGFRYIRIEGISLFDPDDFRAVVLCSDMKRTGYLTSGVRKLNRLFSNLVWGQKGNFVDVPTDCPQRDERLGWTGDAQVFVNTACWQFDAKKFFTKWLDDVKLDQRDNGAIPSVVPDVFSSHDKQDIKASTAWGETATVCPWQVYRHYGDKKLLRSHYDMMKKWVGYMTSVTDTPYLWTGYTKKSDHYGDWLGLDAPEGSYVGSSDKDFIASAFYYYSTGLTIEAGRELGEDTTELEELHDKILEAFRERFPVYKTQTEYVLAIYFDLVEDKEAAAESLAKLIHENGDRLTTGFVGTPYLLYALSQNGQTELAYTLLLQEKFPSWLYSVDQGATTIWEHWDGRKPDGSFWSRDMNSFNHYAYGSVAGWVFEEAAGITPNSPGFETVRIAPKPDERLGELRAEYQTAYGKVSSYWVYTDERIRYEIETPVDAVIEINGETHFVGAGKYLF